MRHTDLTAEIDGWGDEGKCLEYLDWVDERAAGYKYEGRGL